VGGSTCKNDSKPLRKSWLISKVGQHAGINHYTLNRKEKIQGWVNMQEWWVNMNRNDGSSCSGIYTIGFYKKSVRALLGEGAAVDAGQNY
jgi:hypothetical protein